ncbi:MAG: RDD family protein [Acidobacteria bacterium]|nr:RDD family protein [Acidobacteriota bacterium]
MVETTALPQTDAVERARDAQLYAERYRAPFSLRCGAVLIDYIVVASIVVFSTLIARTMGGGARLAGGTAETLGLLIAAAVTLLNFVVLTGLRGQTLGKWATGLRIVRLDGKPLTFLSSLVRHVIGYPLSLITLGLGFLLAVFNPQGRALHDILAGTVVVLDRARRPRTSP